MFNIVCVKYGTKYTSSHVNALYKGVQKNTSIDHRFICFTDDSTGVECETLPIPENETGWWGKLALFKKSLYDLTGIILFIDLDMHINNSINEYLTLGNLDDLYVMRDFRWTTEYSSAIMRFPVSRYSKIWEHYIDIKDKLKGLKVGDQNIINIVYNKNIKSTRSKLIEHLKLIDQNVDVKFWPDSWQKDIRFYKKTEKSDCKIVVGYGSANIFDLKWFN
jgi:hypothetical protein